MENTFSTEHIPLRSNEIQDTIFREHVLFSFFYSRENSTVCTPVEPYGTRSACGGAARACSSRHGAGERNPANLLCALARASCHAAPRVRLYVCLPHAEPRAGGGSCLFLPSLLVVRPCVGEFARAASFSLALSTYMRI